MGTIGVAPSARETTVSPNGRDEGPKDRLHRSTRPNYRCAVQLLPQDRSTVWYVALVTVLAAGLAIGVLLFVLQARGPGADAEFLVASPEAVDCPSGSGVPVCYRFDVTNTGGGGGAMRCLVRPIGDGSAVFTASGTGLYESDGPVAVGDTYSLYTEVEAGDGSSVVERPTLACQSVG